VTISEEMTAASQSILCGMEIMNSDLLRYTHINLHGKHAFMSCELPPSPGERNTDRSCEIKELHHKYHVTHKIRDLYRSRVSLSLYISVHTKLSARSCHVEMARWFYRLSY